MEMLTPGAPAPTFELLSVNDGRRALGDLLKEGPVALAFFKVSCPVCQLAFPFLERMAKGSLQFAGISQDDVSATNAFNARFGVTFPVLIDDSKAGYAVSNAYGISLVPSLFVIEPDGKVSKSFTGFSKSELESLGKRTGIAPFRPDDNVPEWKAG